MSWSNVLAVQELPEGERRVVRVNGQEVLLVNQAGQVYAVGPKCPHLGGPLVKGRVTEDGAIVCPWHRSAFDLRSGDVKEWSPWPPGVGQVLGVVAREHALPTYATKVEEGSIWVKVEEK